MAKTTTRKQPSLEREVITAVVILYVGICAVMLSIHYLQPAGQETITSSTSPSQESFYNRDLKAGAPGGEERPPLGQVETHTMLTQGGYQEIRNLRWDSGVFRATATKDGRTVDIEVDPRSGRVSTQPTRIQ